MPSSAHSSACSALPPASCGIFISTIPSRRARAHVAHHYDLSARLYDLFLDSDRQYSCGYFTHRHHDIERAQLDKKRHLAAKLLLEPGQRVLDIGSGWGGLALYLAEVCGCEVLGVTLSEEQLKASRAAGRARGHGGSRAL